MGRADTISRGIAATDRPTSAQRGIVSPGGNGQGAATWLQGAAGTDTIYQATAVRKGRACRRCMRDQRVTTPLQMTEPGEQRQWYDVIVVGAGAAGLLAAARSAQRGRRTLLVEKNRKAGVKILMSGGTRCNLTHDCDAAGIIAGFGPAGRFLHSPLAALSPRQLVRLINEGGVPTKVEATGKVFPVSDRAVDVRDALLRRLVQSGAALVLGQSVVDVQRRGDGFAVSTAQCTWSCDKLIVTTGGKSYPGCGTSGDGYRWLAAMGHTIRRPRPALVPLTSDDVWVRELSGVTISDALLSVVDPRASAGGRRNGRPRGVLGQRRGAMLFTHFGLSGPAVLDVSRDVTGTAEPRELRLTVDLLPGMAPAAVGELLRSRAAGEGKRLVGSLVGELLPRRLAEALVRQAGVPATRRAAELSRDERSRLVEWIKQARVGVTGSRGFDKAEVTAGGVALGEVDSRTMQSKLVPKLLLAGEILDLDGYIGGYNFQAAFSTGWLAGSSV